MPSNPPAVSLADLFPLDQIFPDLDQDGWPDQVALGLVVPPDLDQAQVWAGILNLVARLALETTALDPPLVHLGRRPRKAGLSLLLNPPAPGPAWAELQRLNPRAMLLTGSGAGQAAVLNGLALAPPGFPVGPPPASAKKRKPKRVHLLDLAESLYEPTPEEIRGRRLTLALDLPAGRLSAPVGLALADLAARAALEATATRLPLAGPGSQGNLRLRIRAGAQPPTISLGRPGVINLTGPGPELARLIRSWAGLALAEAGPEAETADRFRAQVRAASTPPRPAPELPPAIKAGRSWPDEVARLLALVKKLPKGRGPLDGLLFLSRPQERREAIRSRLEDLLRAKGYQPRLTVLNAYKPGLSWLTEVVQPRLARLPEVADLELAYHPWPSRGQTLEMGSRWLQEIFPAPDLVAQGLGLDPGRVRFQADPDLPAAYRFRAWNRSGRLALEESLVPRTTRLPFLPGRPRRGWVHPATSGVKLWRGREVILDLSLATDRETWWRVYQEEWLARLEAAMSARLIEGVKPGLAFWEELRIEAVIDETDLRLGLGRERVCPLEALHEDIYFNLLAFFRDFAARHGLSDQVQLGRIVPLVRLAPPGGRPRARLTARPLPWPRTPPAAPPRPTGLTLEGRKIRLTGPGLDLTLSPPRPTRGRRTKPAAAEPPLDRLFSQAEVLAWLARLGDLDHLTAWPAGHSLQGRPIFGLEAILRGGGRLRSAAKLRLLRPTLLINARHHANEVSSTSAVLNLAWRLAATPEGRAALKEINVVLVPLENADGVATLERLLPHAPDHKLHAARYNALGAEFYADYHAAAPRFPEALVKARLWRRWLPELVLDCHGVPSHEWDQPLAGYAPAGFQEHWLPRALLYAIIPFLDQPGHPRHDLAEEVGRELAQAVAQDEDLTRLNAELADRYRRYAFAAAPEVFPPAAEAGLSLVPPAARTYSHNLAVRRPEITRLEIVTEVADEVVDGALLALCARAHQLLALTLISFLRRHHGGVIREYRPEDGGLDLAWRTRPGEAAAAWSSP